MNEHGDITRDMAAGKIPADKVKEALADFSGKQAKMITYVNGKHSPRDTAAKKCYEQWMAKFSKTISSTSGGGSKPDAPKVPEKC